MCTMPHVDNKCLINELVKESMALADHAAGLPEREAIAQIHRLMSSARYKMDDDKRKVWIEILGIVTHQIIKEPEISVPVYTHDMP